VGQDRSLCCILKTIIRRQSRFYWIPITVHKKRSWRHHSVWSDVIRNVSKRRFRRTRRQENRLSMQCLKARGKRSPKLSGIYRRIWTEAADTKILPFFSGRIRSRRCWWKSCWNTTFHSVWRIMFQIFMNTGSRRISLHTWKLRWEAVTGKIS